MGALLQNCVINFYLYVRWLCLILSISRFLTLVIYIKRHSAIALSKLLFTWYLWGGDIAHSHLPEENGFELFIDRSIKPDTLLFTNSLKFFAFLLYLKYKYGIVLLNYPR